ncbi:hypothetical protein [Bradyrhizobium sp. LHD-71]|uniref:hypothetical protein n=1 Tax=Bradyrhizobium sp. LHD-71 TaxID=3072141 RepID=UPI00280E3A6B|nr:hypothetical protein [Bradyrhizobium sp. LHD-71]MDQ8728146.1 hypothetical protein [Bradyrhizobium sp. LHD-71]
MRTQATIVLLLLLTGAAAAQAPPTNPQFVPSSQATVRCAPIRPPDSGPGTGAPPGQTTGQSREPLSDRLAQSEGLLCPPSNLDPKMQKDAPEEGKTPVIPPPGSPGGDPSVRPK